MFVIKFISYGNKHSITFVDLHRAKIRRDNTQLKNKQLSLCFFVFSFISHPEGISDEITQLYKKHKEQMQQKHSYKEYLCVQKTCHEMFEHDTTFSKTNHVSCLSVVNATIR